MKQRNKVGISICRAKQRPTRPSFYVNGDTCFLRCDILGIYTSGALSCPGVDASLFSLIENRSPCTDVSPITIRSPISSRILAPMSPITWWKLWYIVVHPFIDGVWGCWKVPRLANCRKNRQIRMTEVASPRGCTTLLKLARSVSDMTTTTTVHMKIILNLIMP